MLDYPCLLCNVLMISIYTNHCELTIICVPYGLLPPLNIYCLLHICSFNSAVRSALSNIIPMLEFQTALFDDANGLHKHLFEDKKAIFKAISDRQAQAQAQQAKKKKT